MNTLFFEIFKHFNQMENDILADVNKKLQRIQLVNEEINKNKLHSNGIKNKSNNENKTKKSTKDILISLEKLENDDDSSDKINLKLSDKQEYGNHLVTNLLIIDKPNIQLPIKKESEESEENNFNNQNNKTNNEQDIFIKTPISDPTSQLLLLRQRLEQIETEANFSSLEMIKETVYPDYKKLSRSYKDGMKLYSYINGNIQAKYQDNTIQIWFPNGDWKKLKDNYLYYYYSKNQVTQISHCNGTNEFHYPDGTIERYPPKMKNSNTKSTFIKLEIWLPNNTYKRIICKSKFNNNKIGGDLEEFYPNITYPNRPNKH